MQFIIWADSEKHRLFHTHSQPSQQVISTYSSSSQPFVFAISVPWLNSKRKSKKKMDRSKFFHQPVYRGAGMFLGSTGKSLSASASVGGAMANMGGPGNPGHAPAPGPSVPSVNRRSRHSYKHFHSESSLDSPSTSRKHGASFYWTATVQYTVLFSRDTRVPWEVIMTELDYV